MANIMRRRGEASELAPRTAAAWDPFRMMRDLMQWDPFRDLGTYPAYEQRGFVPDFEVKETKDGYLFKADLPGVKDEDLDISLVSNRLTISGRREAEKQEEGEAWYAYERSYGTFQRSFTLPQGVDAESVKAELKDGVLTLHVPKKPEVQPKKITVGSKAESKAKA
jgi:HSP20 family protein